ncbi:MAG: helix-turn-helix domain-containing protein [Ktedonobacteraceae bacterium]|nr:helix-turn-helix domain-containing protein [Ktedonobacteraceae bacterium]
MTHRRNPSTVSRSPRDQRRPGPANPRYGIPPQHWPDVLHRLQQGESLRQVARVYNVSYQTVWRIQETARKQQQAEGGEA